jgi:hypothetical protein
MSVFTRKRRTRGFTLLETGLATVIVGLGVLATMQLFAACAQQNSHSDRMTIAMNIAANVHEATVGLTFNDPATGPTSFGPEPGETLLTYDDVDDFNGPVGGGGMSFNPPINSMRQPMPELGQYTQVVSVWPVFMSNLTTNSDEQNPDLPQTSYQGAIRLRVRVMYQRNPADQPVEVYRTSWIRLDN